jgi:hypothetical protein
MMHYIPEGNTKFDTRSLGEGISKEQSKRL